VQTWSTEDEDDGDPPRLWAANSTYPGTAFTRSIGDSGALRPYSVSVLALASSKGRRNGAMLLKSLSLRKEFLCVVQRQRASA
jgi:hypothetical protein